MKRSIAGKVSSRVLLLLISALMVLFAGGLFVSYSAQKKKIYQLSSTVSDIFSDLVLFSASVDGLSFDSPEMSMVVMDSGDYACTRYGSDYAYVFIPDTEKGTVTYISVVRNGKLSDAPFDSMSGVTRDYVLSEDEMKVWNGELEHSFVIDDNEFGHEISTLTLIEDEYGNKAIAGIDYPYSDAVIQVLRIFSSMAVLSVAVIGTVFAIVYLIVRKNVSSPAKKISAVMQDYISEGSRSDRRLSENDSREFSMISSAFNSMTDDIEDYLKNISELTRKQSQQETELSIAAKIQMGFLPKNEYNSDGIRIKAFMKPARDVGGDLYYYMDLEDNKTLIAAADVSGKGIAASLFMAVTLILIRQYAQQKLLPGEILEKVNDDIASGNREMLFVTAFVGIFDRNNMNLTYADAGHNPPYIIGEDVRMIECSHGTVLGIFGGEKYENRTVRMKCGETLFVFTDGVNETVNSKKEFYGTQRLEEALLESAKNDPENIIGSVCESIASFSGDADQHDDITMLTLTPYGHTKLYLDVELSEFSKIRDRIMALPIERKKRLELCVAAEERFVNIVSYAYPDGVPDGEKIGFSLDTNENIVITFDDGGVRFDPTQNKIDPGQYDIDTDTGGLGNFITKESSDKTEYEYSENRNIFRIIKYPEEK